MAGAGGGRVCAHSNIKKPLNAGKKAADADEGVRLSCGPRARGWLTYCLRVPVAGRTQVAPRSRSWWPRRPVPPRSMRGDWRAMARGWASRPRWSICLTTILYAFCAHISLSLAPGVLRFVLHAAKGVPVSPWMGIRFDMKQDDLEKEPFAFLVAATYGEGDPPDNAQTFQEWLMDESRPDDLLKNVKYTVRSIQEGGVECISTHICTHVHVAA